MSNIASFKLLDGTEMPWLGFGSGTGDAMSGFKDSAGRLALDAGLYHIDTAQGYGGGKQEEQIGQLIKSSGIPREKLYVVSKLSETRGYSVPVPLDQIEARTRASVQKLGGPPELWLMHNPFAVGDATSSAEEITTTWKIFEKLKDEGVLKSIGVSNFRPKDYEILFSFCKHKPVVNQIEFHPYLLDHLQPVLDIQAKHGIVTESYGPMQPVIRNVGGPLQPVVEKIAERISKDAGKPFEVASVLLKWCKAWGVPAVTTSSKAARIQGYASIDTFPDLTKEEVAAIDAAGRGHHYRFYNHHMIFDFPIPEGVKVMEGPSAYDPKDAIGDLKRQAQSLPE